jgi:uncharacterized protein YqjF (DUF2071 family)
MNSHFLHAAWNNLIMANYVVPQELLAPYIPNKTELDLFEGKAFVSLVGFMFLNTKILGLSIPFHINFEEVNLRFYVKYNDHGNWKRGTVFIKEIVPRAAISFVANNLYGEKYATMKMKHFHTIRDNEIETCYEWKCKDQWNKLSVLSENKSVPVKINSQEEFIAEHYWGYTKYSKTKTFEYEVKHPRWEIFNVLSSTVNCDFKGIYGDEFSLLDNSRPYSVFMAKGSEIKVHHKKILARGK